MAEALTKINLTNFVTLALKSKSREEFLSLDVVSLAKFLADDELLVKSEKEAFDALRNWTMHKPKERLVFLPKLLPMIRLNQLEPDFLKTKVKDFAVEGHCAQLIKSAIKRQKRPVDERDKIEVDFCTKPRKSATEINLFALCSKEIRVRRAAETVVKTFSTKTNQWTQALPSSIISRANLVLASCMRGKYHMIVYEDPESVQKLYSLNLVSMTAEQLPQEVLGMEAFTMDVVDDVLYLMGTYMFGVAPGERYVFHGLSDAHRIRSSALCFVFATREWVDISPMKVPRFGHCSAVLDGKIYVAGGFPVADVECYDPKTDEWSPCAPICRRRRNAEMVASNGYLYMFGGEACDLYNMRFGVCKEVERYDPVENEWSIIAEMSGEMYGFHVISVLDRVYFIGGEDVANKSIKDMGNKTVRVKCSDAKPCAIFDLNTEQFLEDSIPAMPENVYWPIVGHYINE